MPSDYIKLKISYVTFEFFENSYYICRRKAKRTTLSRLYHLLSMEAIDIILLLILAFVFLGLLGWGLKALGWVFEFLTAADSHRGPSVPSPANLSAAVRFLRHEGTCRGSHAFNYRVSEEGM